MYNHLNENIATQRYIFWTFIIYVFSISLQHFNNYITINILNIYIFQLQAVVGVGAVRDPSRPHHLHHAGRLLLRLLLRLRCLVPRVPPRRVREKRIYFRCYGHVALGLLWLYRNFLPLMGCRERYDSCSNEISL